MSIEIYAYLGPHLDDLESRLLGAFEALGFKVALHPEMDLMCPNPLMSLALAVYETPPDLKRISPSIPLFAEFGYQIDEAANTKGKLPKGVRQCTYVVYTRTSAGRSRVSYFMQALTAAILAKETDGAYWCLGDPKAVSGDNAIERVITELRGLEGQASRARKQLQLFENADKADALLKVWRESADPAFDINAIPFREWPTLAAYYSFPHGEPIRPLTVGAKRSWLWRLRKLSWTTKVLVIYAIVTFLLALIYS